MALPINELPVMDVCTDLITNFYLIPSCTILIDELMLSSVKDCYMLHAITGPAVQKKIEGSTN